MTLQRRLRERPGFLLVEAALTVVVVLGGAVPFVVFTETSLTAPAGFDLVSRVVLVAAAALWFVLVVHAVYDAVRFARHRDAYDLEDGTVWITAGFRFLATLGVVGPFALPVLLFDSGDGPAPAGFAVALVLVAGAAITAGGLVATVHLAWIAWTGRGTGSDAA